MSPGDEVVYQNEIWVLIRALHLTNYHYAVHLWSAAHGLRKAYVDGTLAKVTDDARRLAEERGWTVPYAARYLGAAPVIEGMIAAWKRNKRGRRGGHRDSVTRRTKRRGRVPDGGLRDLSDPEVA